MAEKIKGITIEFDGDVSKLQKSLRAVDKATKDIDTELKNVNRALKFNPGNIDLITQKQRLLSEKIEQTKEKLNSLKEIDKQAKAQLESGNLGQAEYDKLQREIIETESQLKSFKSTLSDIGNVKIQALGDQLQNIGTKLKGVGDKIAGVGSNLSAKVTAPLVAIGGASFKMAADLQDAHGATEQIFKGAADQMKDWADNLDSAYGIAEGEALGYANTMGAMLQNIGGMNEKEAAKQSQVLTQLAGDLSAMFGGTTESAVQALTGALKGNTSMLDNYGMGVNDATIKQKAMEMGLYSGTGALGLQEKQAATLALIMEQTSDAQGQAGREAQGASGSMKSLATEVKNLSTDIGQQLIPIITPLIQKVGEWVGKFKELSPETQQMIVKIALIAAAIGPLLLIVGKMISTIGSITTGLGGLMKFVSANPIVLIIAAIAAAALIIYNNWENIKNWTSNLWQSVTNTWNNLKNGITNTANNIKANVSNTFSNLKSTVSNIWEGIKNAISNPINRAKEIVSNAIDRIKGILSGSISFPHIKLPHFNITGKFSLNPPQIPRIGVEWYAKGGVFDSPSIIGVGEKGSEAVVPTNKLDKFFADALNRVWPSQKSSSGININIEKMEVRKESDIKKIANELFRMIRTEERSLGVV